MPARSIRRPTLALLIGALLLLCAAAPATARIGLTQHRVVERGKAYKMAKPRAYGHSRAGITGAKLPGTLFQGDRLGQFWLAQSAEGAITEAPNPDGDGDGVFKMTVANQDVYPITPTENPRAELLSPPTIEPGDEIWWSAEFFLPSDFPSSTPNFVTLLQGPYGRPFNGPPPFHIEVNGSHIQWQRNDTYDWDVPWQMDIVRDSWVHVMIHERFAEDGFVEMWINGKPITFFSERGLWNPDHVPPTTRLEMATIDSSNDEGNGSIYLQSYRKAGMYQSLTVFQGPLTIGETRESVEPVEN